MSRMTIQQVLHFAQHQLGVPYTWGGTTRQGGFDCSGLIWRAYRKAGYTGIGRTTYEQIHQGIGVGMHDLQPGDIVFPSREHEGLYIGNGMVIEAPHTGDHVKVIPLAQFGFMTARRLVRGGGGIVPPRGIGGVSQAGLPIPHSDPSMRAPHPQASTANALAFLLATHGPQSQPSTFRTPSPSTALTAIDTPELPNQPLTQQMSNLFPTLGRSAGQLQSGLDATRRELLSV